MHFSLPAAVPPVANMEGGHSLHSFINSYEMMFFTLFALLAGTAITIIGGSIFFYVFVSVSFFLLLNWIISCVCRVVVVVVVVKVLVLSVVFIL